ncbi:hypothetical protein CLV53_113100 [Sediminibacterium magnilacihabitans]|nr:hypothetical protein CLV53_113100 [Sediminibacterium magnilacihabitans]
MYKPDAAGVSEICDMKKTLLLFFLLHFSLLGFSQKTDSTKTLVTGSVSVTNNGISTVPTFSLEKPAAIFNLSVRRNRFSFEPELAFGFKDAKPWYFVFWFRYKLVETAKFNMGVGFHPGFVFSTTNILDNGVNKEYFTTSRFFVGELTPSYALSKNTSIGFNYLHARGYNSDLRQLNFLGLSCNFSNIGLGNRFFIKAVPQVYYLKTDDTDGVYLTSTFTFAKRGCPFSVSSVMNKTLRTTIPGDDFLWNISLTYSY